jgi:hypothetical protein
MFNLSMGMPGRIVKRFLKGVNISDGAGPAIRIKSATFTSRPFNGFNKELREAGDLSRLRNETEGREMRECPIYARIGDEEK